MKTLVIFVLLLVIAAGSFLSKPDQQSFEKKIRDEMKGSVSAAAAKSDKNALQKLGEAIFGGDAPTSAAQRVKAEVFLEKCTYHNNILWMSVEYDGKTVYTGAFSTWFKTGDFKEPGQP